MRRGSHPPGESNRLMHVVNVMTSLGVLVVVIGAFSSSGCSDSSTSSTSPAAIREKKVISRTVFAHRNYLETVRHDGHRFIVYRVDSQGSDPDRPGGPLHHPSCDHVDCSPRVSGEAPALPTSDMGPRESLGRYKDIEAFWERALKERQERYE